jgi:hypothetical protein
VSAPHCRSQRRTGQQCTAGRRKTETHLLCGAVLPLWMRLEELHKNSCFGITTKKGKMPLRVVKVITGTGATLFCCWGGERRVSLCGRFVEAIVPAGGGHSAACCTAG